MARIASLHAIIWTLMTGHCLAVPRTNFGFNAQVPTVARVGQPYFFQFTTSTFAPTDANFTYSLTNQPAWLVLDSATRTLSGVPGESDAGSSVFMLSATDETGPASMPCTLVVSTNQVPQLQGDLGEQLAAEANLSSSVPAIVTLIPGLAFEFHFRQNSFIDIVQRKLFYYATLTDHTPLPGWLHFDATTLTFSGDTPQLSAFPQSWQIALIASDVEGFAGSSSSFTIVIGLQQLVFSPQEQDVQVIPGSSVQVPDLLSTLYLNGQSLVSADLSNVQASALPTWLNFDNSTLVFSGTVPSDFTPQNITVAVSDSMGDSATVTLRMTTQAASTTIFNGTIGSLDAKSGEHFEYTIPSTVVNDPDVSLGVILPTTAIWLEFDEEARLLKGDVPTETTSTTIVATLTARAANVPEAQTLVFSIEVQAATSTHSLTTTLATSTHTPTDSATSTPVLAAGTTSARHHLNKGIIAGIIIFSVLALMFMLAILICCYRRRKREGYDRHFNPSKRDISRPIVPPAAENITVTTELQRDVEKTGESTMGAHVPTEDAESPPQIQLNLPRHSARASKWTNRFSRISLASSIGNGEDAIRADNNIPEWGGESAALNTPHDSFSAPAQMARMSRQLSQISPSKRALRRRLAKHNLRDPGDSVGLGIGMSETTLGSLQKSKRKRSQKKSRGSNALSATMDRSSCGSLSTRGTSVLADTFPRPPVSSIFTRGRSSTNFSAAETEKRKSVRLLGRNGSTNDGRSLQDKRESFVKKMRASTSRTSTLWSNKLNGHLSDADELGGSRLRRSGRDESSYTKSSSIEPKRQSNRFSQRIRSTFGPDYPRTVAVFRGDRCVFDDANDEEWEDASADEDLEAIHEHGSDEMHELDWREELTVPKHQRQWRHPAEDLTPPPTVPPNSRFPSSQRASTPGSEFSAKQRLRHRVGHPVRSSSPLATSAMNVPTKDRTSLASAAKANQGRRSRMSTPLDLMGEDSPDKPWPERPRLYQTNSGRPTSVDKVERLSSLRAERETLGDTIAGSEPWEGEQVEGSPLVLRNECSGSVRVGTGRSGMSAMSGPVFI